jgi:hypothetical protein
MIQEIIDDILKPKEGHKSSGNISPSGLGQCYRRQYWTRKQEPVSNPIDSRMLRVFAMGNMVEKFVLEKVLLRYPDWKTQVEITKEDIHGYADLVSEDEVIDIKSQHSRKFWYNTNDMKNGVDIRDLFYSNWMQVMLYAWILDKSKARLVYVSKDDLCIQEYCIDFDNYWKNELDTELTNIRYYWEFKTTPPANPRLYGGEETKKECRFCQYKTKCEETESVKRVS